jgi:hypothetical protein
MTRSAETLNQFFLEPKSTVIGGDSDTHIRSLSN